MSTQLLAARLLQLTNVMRGFKYSLFAEATTICGITLVDILELAREEKGDVLPIPVVGDYPIVLGNSEVTRMASNFIARILDGVESKLGVIPSVMFLDLPEGFMTTCRVCNAPIYVSTPKLVGFWTLLIHTVKLTYTELSKYDSADFWNYIDVQYLCGECARNMLEKLYEHVTSEVDKLNEVETSILLARTVHLVEQWLFQELALYIHLLIAGARSASGKFMLRETWELVGSLRKYHNVIAESMLTHIPEIARTIEKLNVEVDLEEIVKE